MVSVIIGINLMVCVPLFAILGTQVTVFTQMGISTSPQLFGIFLWCVALVASISMVCMVANTANASVSGRFPDLLQSQFRVPRTSKHGSGVAGARRTETLKKKLFSGPWTSASTSEILVANVRLQCRCDKLHDAFPRNPDGLHILRLRHRHEGLHTDREYIPAELPNIVTPYR